MKVERLTEIKKLLDLVGEMPEALAKSLHEWFRVELTYTSNAQEQRFTLQEIKSKLFGMSHLAEDIMNRYKSTFEKLAD